MPCKTSKPGDRNKKVPPKHRNDKKEKKNEKKEYAKGGKKRHG